MIEKFFSSNETIWRLLRTIVQGIIGVVIANIDIITGQMAIGDIWRPVIAGVVMAILSPIMASIGKKEDEHDSSNT